MLESREENELTDLDSTSSDNSKISAGDSTESEPTPDRPTGRYSASFRQVALLVGLTFGISTVISTFSYEKTNFLLKDTFAMTAGAMATFQIIVNVPNYLRPFLGSLSDLVPIFGYHRRSYYVLGTVVAALSYGALAMLHSYQYLTIALLLIGSYAGTTTLLIIADAVMVSIGNRTGSVGMLQSIQQFIQPLLSVAGLAIIGGYVTQHWSYSACFMGSAVASLASLPLFLFIEERPVLSARQSHESAEEHRARAALKAEERARTVSSLKTAAKSTELWAVVGFVFYLIFTPSNNNAQLFFMVNHLKFSKLFIGELDSPNSIGTMVGIVLFGFMSSRMPVRAIVWGAWAGDCLSYVVFFGMHGHTSAIVVNFLYGIIGIVYSLCLYTIAARACPPGIEGTAYGLVMATIYFAGTLSEKVGDSIFDWLGGEKAASITYAWNMDLVIGLLVTVPAALLIPFLPKWTRSNEPLKPKEIAVQPLNS